MSVELEDLWFVMKQIVDLKSLTDDQHHQVQINKYDITGIVTKDWPRLSNWGCNSMSISLVVAIQIKN